MCDGSGQRIWLLASEGDENVPSLGDEVPAGSHAAKIVRFHTSPILQSSALPALPCLALLWNLVMMHPVLAANLPHCEGSVNVPVSLMHHSLCRSALWYSMMRRNIPPWRAGLQMRRNIGCLKVVHMLSSKTEDRHMAGV